MESIISSLKEVSLNDRKSDVNLILEPLGFECDFVDNEEKLEAMLDLFDQRFKSNEETLLNADFEGVNLCRDGVICLGQFHLSESKKVYVVDFISMDPFKVVDGRLKDLLESESIKKVLFDPRNDCDALFNLHKVRLKNAICLQLCEAAYRKYKRYLRVKYVFGLQKTMEEYVNWILPEQKKAMIKIKQDGKMIFIPEMGGSYEKFKERPLSKELLAYCAVDVYYFDGLRGLLYSKLPIQKRNRVERLSESRLREGEQCNYNPHGRVRAICPSI